jgi:hydroxymethylpyrimidine/phosphomethylpyrimidine kinase
LNSQAVDVLTAQLLPMATLITPNMDEARVLSGRALHTRSDLEACAKELAARYSTAVLLKGGHLAGDEAAADCLVTAQGSTHWFESQRIHGVSTHGTGCSYSAAIATGLGQGLPLLQAVAQAKEFIARAIAQYHVWQGNTAPVHALHHFAS